MIFTKSISSDDFMGPHTKLQFEDGSNLIFREQVNFNYLYSGKHEINIRHLLNQDEFYQLKSKKVKSFSILYYRNSFDKFQMEKILNAIIKIETEKPSN